MGHEFHPIPVAHGKIQRSQLVQVKAARHIARVEVPLRPVDKTAHVLHHDFISVDFHGGQATPGRLPFLIVRRRYAQVVRQQQGRHSPGSAP